ncbi:hypothetical protein MTO96_015711 [Rhipicephalus appendiculatus]
MDSGERARVPGTETPGQDDDAQSERESFNPLRRAEVAPGAESVAAARPMGCELRFRWWSPPPRARLPRNPGPVAAETPLPRGRSVVHRKSRDSALGSRCWTYLCLRRSIWAAGAGGALDDGGPPSPFLMGGVPSSPSPDDKGRSAGVGGATAGGVGPLAAHGTARRFPLAGRQAARWLPLVPVVRAALVVPPCWIGSLSCRCRRRETYRGGSCSHPCTLDSTPSPRYSRPYVTNKAYTERMASCLDLAARSYAHQQAAAAAHQQRTGANKGGSSPHDVRSQLLGAPTLPFPPGLHDRWRSPHHVQDLMSSAGDNAASPPSPFGTDRSGSPAKGLDLKRTDHLTGFWPRFRSENGPGYSKSDSGRNQSPLAVPLLPPNPSPHPTDLAYEPTSKSHAEGRRCINDSVARRDLTAGPLGSPKWTLGQATSCPVCGITLAQAQMADHFQLEMDKLADFYSCRRWVDRTHEDSLPLQPEPQSACRTAYEAGKRSPLSRWESVADRDLLEEAGRIPSRRREFGIERGAPTGTPTLGAAASSRPQGVTGAQVQTKQSGGSASSARVRTQLRWFPYVVGTSTANAAGFRLWARRGSAHNATRSRAPLTCARSTSREEGGGRHLPRSASPLLVSEGHRRVHPSYVVTWCGDRPPGPNERAWRHSFNDEVQWFSPPRDTTSREVRREVSRRYGEFYSHDGEICRAVVRIEKWRSWLVGFSTSLRISAWA